MAKESDKLRLSKVLRAKQRIDSGFYDEFIQDIVNLIISGNKDFLEATGIYEEIPRETKLRVNLSFYAAILSMLFGFAIFTLGLFFAWEFNLLAGSVIASIGATISGFITKTFLKIHQISLEQLNRFYKPILKEIFSVIKQSIEDISDSEAKERARISLVEALLQIVRESRLDFRA